MGIELTRCLDADKCRNAVECLRATLPVDEDALVAHFWGGEGQRPCLYFVDSTFKRFVERFEEQL